MEMRGEYQISADRQTVWDALNEPEVLRDCLEGCESFDKVSNSDFKARITTKVGPIKTTFACSIQLTDIDPPNAYTISGQGNGGASGFARGSIKVSLSESEGATVLGYAVDASLRGKIGQMGSRVVNSVARSMADKFFGNFMAIVDKRTSAASEIESAPIQENTRYTQLRVILIAAACAIVILGLGYLLLGQF